MRFSIGLPSERLVVFKVVVWSFSQPQYFVFRQRCLPLLSISVSWQTPDGILQSIGATRDSDMDRVAPPIRNAILLLTHCAYIVERSEKWSKD